MSKASKIIIAIVVVVIVTGGAIWYKMANSEKAAAPPATNNSSSNSDNSTTQEADSTIVYNGSFFKVSKDKIKSGSIVKVMNNSDKDLDFDSDPHPVHTDNTELNEGEIAPGKSKIFTLVKVGTWGFHNHLDSSQHGTITVE